MISVVVPDDPTKDELEDNTIVLLDKKKKRTKPSVVTTQFQLDDLEKGKQEEVDNYAYTHEFLLKRLYSFLDSTAKDRLRLIPPIVGMLGGKRTHISNFGQVCEGMNREPEHVSLFISIEFFTNVSLNPERKLTIRGKFRTEQIQNILRSYISKYLLCQACKTYNTHLARESRIHFLKCETCQSQRAVEALKQPVAKKV